MTTHDELVRLIAPAFRLDPAAIAGDRSLFDYGLDSLEVVDVMFMVEEHYGIELPGDTSRFTCIDDLVAIVDRLRSPHCV